MLGRSLGRSLINGSISVLINYYRKVLGSFSERLYWFGSRCCSGVSEVDL
uniref:Uncharacterized protein n=1 Tax=Acinetobacter phage vB_Ab_1137_KEN_07 TaxID=3158854 RepID=A0AAU8KZN7_9CAUD